MSSRYQPAMESQYDFSINEDGDEIIQIKSKDSYPYRIRKDGTVWKLAQSFSPRVNIEPKFKSIGKFYLTRDDALERIIKRHNKSCEYMTNWIRI